MEEVAKPRANRRARLPLFVRRKIQRVVRNFVFFGIAYITIYNAYITINNYRKAADALKMFGFVPGII